MTHVMVDVQVGRYTVTVSVRDEPDITCQLSCTVAPDSVSPAHCVATCSDTCEAGRPAKLVVTRADRFGNKVRGTSAGGWGGKCNVV